MKVSLSEGPRTTKFTTKTRNIREAQVKAQTAAGKYKNPLLHGRAKLKDQRQQQHNQEQAAAQTEPHIYETAPKWQQTATAESVQGSVFSPGHSGEEGRTPERLIAASQLLLSQIQMIQSRPDVGFLFPDQSELWGGSTGTKTSCVFKRDVVQLETEPEFESTRTSNDE